MEHIITSDDKRVKVTIQMSSPDFAAQEGQELVDGVFKAVENYETIIVGGMCVSTAPKLQSRTRVPPKYKVGDLVLVCSEPNPPNYIIGHRATVREEANGESGEWFYGLDFEDMGNEGDHATEIVYLREGQLEAYKSGEGNG